MLSGESTPLLKESIELRPSRDEVDIEGVDRNSCLFGGTKVLQSTTSATHDELSPPDQGCLAVVLRTGFGTSQGQLIRTMIFSTETVSANNLESFLFIAFLLVFALAASAYVWVKGEFLLSLSLSPFFVFSSPVDPTSSFSGVEQDRKRSKLLLDCVIIITSVVPPELPMELSMAVNASLVALSKFCTSSHSLRLVCYCRKGKDPLTVLASGVVWATIKKKPTAIFCTEPFRIPFAGRVDICCFDKTGTITGENLVVEGVAGVE